MTDEPAFVCGSHYESGGREQQHERDAESEPLLRMGAVKKDQAQRRARTRDPDQSEGASAASSCSWICASNAGSRPRSWR
jgi:hypothetical protein